MKERITKLLEGFDQVKGVIDAMKIEVEDWREELEKGDGDSIEVVEGWEGVLRGFNRVVCMSEMGSDWDMEGNEIKE